MEMMLDHYRRAAMQGGGAGGAQGFGSGEGSDITSPRGGIQEPLADSAILEGRVDLQTQILKWYFLALMYFSIFFHLIRMIFT